jgi:hypothetical protein
MMDPWIVLIIAAAFFFGWKIQQRKKETVTECLKRQGMKRNGLVKTAFLAYPRLSFCYLDTEILVSAMSGGILGNRSRASKTYATFYLPDFSDDWFDIRNKSKGNALDRVLGLKDIQIENPEFDARFTIRASDAVLIRTFLTRDLQERLLQFTPGEELYVQFTKKALFQEGRLVLGEQRPCLSVSIRKILTDEGEFDRLIETALLFHDRLKSLL